MLEGIEKDDLAPFKYYLLYYSIKIEKQPTPKHPQRLITVKWSYQFLTRLNIFIAHESTKTFEIIQLNKADIKHRHKTTQLYQLFLQVISDN